MEMAGLTKESSHKGTNHDMEIFWCLLEKCIAKTWSSHVYRERAALESAPSSSKASIWHMTEARKVHKMSV
jgi:hypothetical protein